MTALTPSGGRPIDAVALNADRGHLRATLRRNTAYVGTYLLLSAIVGAGIVALAVSDIGRLATYFLLSLLLVILLASLVLGLWLRRRVRGFLRAEDPLLILTPEALLFSGIPPVPWPDVLGVVYCDERAGLARGGGLSRWMRRLTYRAGGSQVTLHVGIARPKRFRAGASGGLTRYLSTALDLGGITLPLDAALGDPQLHALTGALRELSAAGVVRYLETDDPRRVGRAASSMATGRPMRRDA